MQIHSQKMIPNGIMLMKPYVTNSYIHMRVNAHTQSTELNYIVKRCESLAFLIDVPQRAYS